MLTDEHARSRLVGAYGERGDGWDELQVANPSFLVELLVSDGTDSGAGAS